MAEITLRPVTADNWRAITKLALADEQKKFVAPNWYSIIEVLFEPENLHSRAIYAGDELVGYTMFGRDSDTGRHWIVRLMTDVNQQKKGYGRAAMVQIINLLKSLYSPGAIYISFAPENTVAQALYEKLGFTDTGEIDDGEKVFRLAL